MKKPVLCILALLLALMLCGCEIAAGEGNSTETTAPTSPTVLAQNAEGETVALEYDMAIPVTFLSDFTLYLNNDMTLVAMEATNEEGSALLEGIDISGKSYAEAINLMLENAHQQGQFAHGEIIQFIFPSEIISSSLMEDLFMPVIQFIHDNKVYVHIDWDVIPIEEPDFEANYLYGLQKIEGEEQTFYIDRWECAMPNSGKFAHYNYYFKMPDVASYSVGPAAIGNALDAFRSKVVLFFEEGGFTVTYFKDGFQTKSVICRDSKIELYEYANRAQTNWILKDETSTLMTEQELTVLAVFNQDDVQGVSTYYPNCKTATEVIYYPDGSISYRTYDENGNEIHTYLISKSADGTYSEAEFENGQEVYQKTVNPDGTYMEGHCENGNWTWTEGTIEPTDPANE